MSKSEKMKYRVWFLILAVLTLCSGVYLAAIEVLRYFHTEPLMNLDIPLLLYAEDSLNYEIRLRNTGNYLITITEVRLEGDAYVLGPGGWSLDSEGSKNQIKPAKGSQQDAVLHLDLEGQKMLNQSPRILIIYQYGWFRNKMILEIKTELSSS